MQAAKELALEQSRSLLQRHSRVSPAVPTAVTTGIPQTVTGWANASTGIQADIITTLQYSLNGAANVTLAAGSQNNTFSITVIFPNTANSLVVWAKDSKGTWSSDPAAVPTVATAQSFTFSTTTPPKQTTLGSFNSIQATVTNNQPQALSVVVIVSLTNTVAQNGFTAGSTAGIFSTTASGATAIPADTTVTLNVVVSGLPHGSYTATIFVLSTAGVALSPSTTLSVTL